MVDLEDKESDLPVILISNVPENYIGVILTCDTTFVDEQIVNNQSGSHWHDTNNCPKCELDDRPYKP